jgi:hypothetical protein
MPRLRRWPLLLVSSRYKRVDFQHGISRACYERASSRGAVTYRGGWFGRAALCAATAVRRFFLGRQAVSWKLRPDGRTTNRAPSVTRSPCAWRFCVSEYGSAVLVVQACPPLEGILPAVGSEQKGLGLKQGISQALRVLRFRAYRKSNSTVVIFPSMRRMGDVAKRMRSGLFRSAR